MDYKTQEIIYKVHRAELRNGCDKVSKICCLLSVLKNAEEKVSKYKTQSKSVHRIFFFFTCMD